MVLSNDMMQLLLDSEISAGRITVIPNWADTDAIRSVARGENKSLDHRRKDEVPHRLTAADLYLVPLTKELPQCLMPSRPYGIRAAGRPYLANAPEGSELHRLTVENRVKTNVRSNSPPVIQAAIRCEKSG